MQFAIYTVIIFVTVKNQYLIIIFLSTVFGLDSPLGLFPPGIDPGKLYNPLMEMSDPRDMPGGPPPFLKKKSKYKHPTK